MYEEVRGTATLDEERGHYAIVPDSTYVMFIPNNLPQEFREDGLRVLFAGKVPEPDPAVRHQEVRIELTDRSSPDFCVKAFPLDWVD